MRVTQAAARYRPVTTVLETQDEHDMFFAIIEQVAENRTNHTPAGNEGRKRDARIPAGLG